MTYSYNSKNKDITLSAESVVAYLTSNPEFFLQNPELLKQLTIPHGLHEDVPSLIEHQVSLLREESEQLKKEIKQNSSHAITQRHLRQYLFQFVLQILNAGTIEGLYELLNMGLEKYFAANKVKIFIFSNSIKSGQAGDIYFLASDTKLRFMFTELLNRNKPLCSSLQTEQLQMLFDKEAGNLKSNLLIPIKQSDWTGLFVLGSYERNQYCHGEELDMLMYISEVTSFKLQLLWNK